MTVRKYGKKKFKIYDIRELIASDATLRPSACLMTI